MPAFTASQASVTNNSKVVQINSGESIANVNSGDFLVLAGFIIEINRAYLGGDGKGYFELVKNWPNSNQTNQECIVIPTTGEFKKAVDALTSANVLVNDNFKAMQDWQTKTGTVTFTNQDGTTTTVKTLKQIEADNLAQMDAYHPYPWAMRKAEFEAKRAENKRKFVSGVVSYGKHNKTETAVNQGLYQYSSFTYEAQQNNILMGRAKDQAPTDCHSMTDAPVFCISGVLFNFATYLNGTYEQVRIFFESAEKGLLTYDTDSRALVEHATPDIAFASETDTNKVLKSRVDMMGVEVWLRKITPEDPHVYPHGTVQCVTGSIDGMTPVGALGTKSQSYYSWHKGDDFTIGRGFDWYAMSESQKIKLASNPQNNIYFDDEDGFFYQWCIRGITKGGAINGDWINVDSLSTSLASHTYLRLPIKANNDTSEDWIEAGADNHYYGGKGQGVHLAGEFTAFSGDGNARYSANGQAYFLPLFTVNRLNQGLYHPSLNPDGTALASDGKMYYETTVSFTTAAECFDTSKLLADSGSLISGLSGRFDGRYHDAIYIDGFGGVCQDLRYSSTPLEIKDFIEFDQKAKAGKYRGREKLVFTLPTTATYATESILESKKVFRAQGQVGDIAYLEDRRTKGFIVLSSGETIEFTRVRHFSETDQTYFYTNIPQSESSPAWTGNVHIIMTRKVESSISGQFLHLDVVGTPAQLLACDELKKGWLGGWIKDLPNDTNDYFELTRPIEEDSVITRYLTDDNGASWTKWTGTSVNKNVPNVLLTNNPSNRIVKLLYTSKSVITVPDSRATLLHGVASFQSVFAYSRGDMTGFGGRDLGFSLMGKQTNSNAGVREQTLSFNTLGINMDSGVPAGGSVIAPSSHDPILLYGVDGTRGFKAASYPSTGVKAGEVNEGPVGYGYLYYSFSELTHNGVDWGDDQKINVFDYTGLMLDENGNSNITGTAKLVDKLGWLKYGS
ncbi:MULTISPECIES: hypothetical protein [Pseudoalteromonas]|uniref:hypothetical protein n=1 Tax=Pseudoalteromonas TaxID=53246 RepID=UPI00272AD572|nr:hypothetical protein [Pseudoalteromonas sp.]